MDLTYTVDDEHVALIMLNRPHRKNAFTFEMLDAWAQALRRARVDDDVRAVVVAGAAKNFCAGVDLDQLQRIDDTPIAHKHMLTRMVHPVAHEVERLDKPLIAAVDGVAVGAGMDMALMCDIRFATPATRFSEGYIRVGLVPGDGGCFFLPRIVGEAKALELLLTGDTVGGEEALRIGLASRLYSSEELLEETLRFARRLAAQPPLNVGFIKSTVRQSRNLDMATSLDLISSHMAVVMATADHREALSAFRERRHASYGGR